MLLMNPEIVSILSLTTLTVSFREYYIGAIFDSSILRLTSIPDSRPHSIALLNHVRPKQRHSFGRRRK